MVETDEAELDSLAFNDARHGLLEALATEEGVTLLALQREYNHNAEFRGRVDLAALNMSCPTSQAFH